MISVIVPVYKAEKYLHRCVDSILAQNYTDFELLLIDDGSPDRCGVICDEYATKDNRVRVFHKVNGGVSSARNLGLDAARGEWVTFVDSDDYVNPDFLKSLYTEHDADLIVGSFRTIGSDEKWDGVIEQKHYNRVLIEKNVVDLSLKIHFYTPWAKLFNLNIIKNNCLHFDEKIHSGEDWLFVLNYLVYISSLRTCSSPYYYYERGNMDGLSQNCRGFDEYFYSMSAFYEVTNLMKKVYGDGVKVIYLNSLAGFCVKQCQYLYSSKESVSCKLKKLRQMQKDVHLNSLFKDSSILWRRKVRLFHLLMSNRFLLTSLVYLYMLNGKIY